MKETLKRTLCFTPEGILDPKKEKTAGLEKLGYIDGICNIKTHFSDGTSRYGIPSR